MKFNTISPQSLDLAFFLYFQGDSKYIISGVFVDKLPEQLLLWPDQKQFIGIKFLLDQHEFIGFVISCVYSFLEKSFLNKTRNKTLYMPAVIPIAISK
jgi:hypothetical protein